MVDSSDAKKVIDVIDLAHQAGFDISFGFTIHLFTHGDTHEYQSDIYEKEISIYFNSVEEVISFLMGLRFQKWYDIIVPADHPAELDLRLRR